MTNLTAGDYARVTLEGRVTDVQGVLEIRANNTILPVAYADGRPFPWMEGARLRRLSEDPVDEPITDPDERFGYGGALDSAVMEALGAASSCWENLEGAGVFDSTRCGAIGERLLELLAAREASVRAGS